MYEPEIKLEVRRLRHQKGLTFKEIMAEFPSLSKSTVSYWVRDIQLKPEHKERILYKQLQRRIEFQKYNKCKHLRAIRDTNRIMSRAAAEVGELSKKELKIAGAALYWAEGHNKSDHVIEFVNSDPKMVLFIMRFFREVLKINEQRFRCRMTLHPSIDVNKCLKFWSRLTGIPRRQFNKTYTKPPRSSTGKMHNILYRGTICIRACDVAKLRQLKGYILALKKHAPIV